MLPLGLSPLSRFCVLEDELSMGGSGSILRFILVLEDALSVSGLGSVFRFVLAWEGIKFSRLNKVLL